MPNGKRLFDQVSHTIHVKHCSYRTEQTGMERIKCTLFHGRRHPKDMAVDEIQSFLPHLACEKNVATSTQDQALSVLLFLYGNPVKSLPLVWDASLPACAAVKVPAWIKR